MPLARWISKPRKGPGQINSFIAIISTGGATENVVPQILINETSV